MEIHIDRNGERFGPYSLESVNAYLANGTLVPTDLAWQDGMQNWVPLSQIPGIRPPDGIVPSITSGEIQRKRGFHSQRIAFAITAGIGMLATFLPWAHIPLLGSIEGTAGDGWITLALFIPALALSFKGTKHLPLTFGSRTGAVIPAALALWIGFDKISKFSEIAKDAGDNPFSKALSSSVKIGSGIYLLIIAGIAIIIIALVFPRPQKV